MRAAIVIVTYNHAAIIGTCLRAVLATVPDDVETIVVDNASTDDTAEFVRREFPGVRVVASEHNTGYGGGNNLGAAHARAEVMVFLNPDTQPRAGWLEPLLAALEDDGVGLVTPKLLLASDPSRIDTLGNEVHLSGITPSRKWREPSSVHTQTEEVSAISGACFAARRDIFDILGGFDERYFLYYEDTDLSLRARLAGFRCLAVPASEVVHDHRPGFSPEKLRHLERNRYWTLLKLLDLRTLVALTPALLLAELLAWGMAVKNGPRHVMAKALSWVDLVRWLPRLTGERRTLGRRRRIADGSLLRLHSTRLRFGQAVGGTAGKALELMAGLVFGGSRWLVDALVREGVPRSNLRGGALRIAHVTATFPPYWGGTSNVAWHNARELARLGHEVHVFTAGGGGTHYDQRDPEGVVVHRLRPLLRIGNAPLLPGLLGSLRGFDLIHLHYPFIFGAELVGLVARLTGTTYVVTFHNALIGDGRRAALFWLWERTFGRLVFAGAARVLAVSLDHAASAPWLTRFARRQPVEMPNGVDVSLFRPLEPDERDQQRARFGADTGSFVLLFVAALDRAHHFKGLSLLLRTLEDLSDRKIKLVVVGDGDLRATYEKEAARRGVDARVRFCGAVPHEATPSYFGSADLLVLPTEPPESFGLVLIEALACGTPVVASDIPGVREVVTRTGGGVLFPAGDATRLAATVAALLDDPERRARMAASGRDMVMSRYAWGAIAPRLEAVYRDVSRMQEAHAEQQLTGPPCP